MNPTILLRQTVVHHAGSANSGLLQSEDGGARLEKRVHAHFRSVKTKGTGGGTPLELRACKKAVKEGVGLETTVGEARKWFGRNSTVGPGQSRIDANQAVGR